MTGRRRLNTMIAAALLVGLTTTPALANPTLSINPTLVQVGGSVEMTTTGFVPGGYDVDLVVDGSTIQQIYIPAGGARTFTWNLPPEVGVGGHDIALCAACGQGDLEEATDNVRITVSSGNLTGSEFNLQPWGIEVTQGVRADFAFRTPPEAGSDLADEAAVHVANRRTVVRVYPWVETGPDITRVYNVVARLWVTRDGVTYGPVNSAAPTVWEVRADATLESVRSNLRRSWNFVLPSEAVSLAPTETSGSFDLFVEVNPAGPWQIPECPTCLDDNTIRLNNNEFRHVGRSSSYAVKLRGHLVEANVEQSDGSTNFVRRPTVTEFANTVRKMFDVLPIADGNRGIRLMPWRNVDWEGTQDGWDPVQDLDLIRDYLPGGSLTSAPPNDFYGFFYSGDTNCGGHALRDTPFFRTPTCVNSYVAAHELNHAIGASHAGNGHGEGAGGGYDHAYPGSHGEVESNSWGVNVYNLKLYPPRDPATSIETHDFMSYGGTTEWVSRYSWDLTAENLGTPEIDLGKRRLAFPDPDKSQTDATDYVAFKGLRGAIGPIDVDPFFGGWSPDGSQGDGSFQLEFTGANAVFLSSVSPTLHRAQDLDQQLEMFAEAIALPIGWEQMTLYEGTNALQTWTRSANPPQVSLTSPAPDFQWANTGIATLAWTSFDADGDDLVYRVSGQHGTDGEVFVLANGLTSETYDLDLASLPGGGNWTLAVEASDGLDHTWSQTVDGWVDPTPPQVMILEPPADAVFVAGQDVVAMALAADLQGEIPDTDLGWYLDGNWVGAGSSFELPAVTVGVHQLELITYNNYQLAGNASLQFTVVAQLVAPQPVAPADGAVDIPRAVLLDWDPVPGAVSYRVMLGDSPNFDGQTGEEGNISGTQINFDVPLEYNQTIYWRVMAEHGSAPSDWSPVRSFTPVNPATAVDDLPTLHDTAMSVYPNPFNPATTIAFDLPRPGPVAVEVYDLAGRRVRALFSGPREAGHHELTWNGRDEQGLGVGSGVYLVRLVTTQGALTQRALLLK